MKFERRPDGTGLPVFYIQFDPRSEMVFQFKKALHALRAELLLMGAYSTFGISFTFGDTTEFRTFSGPRPAELFLQGIELGWNLRCTDNKWATARRS